MTSPEIIGYEEQLVTAGDEYPYVVSGDGYDGIVSGADEIGVDIGADDDLRHLLAISGADDYVGYDPEIGYETDIGASVEEARRRRLRPAIAPRQVVRPRQAIVRPRQVAAAPVVARPAAAQSVVRAAPPVPQAVQSAAQACPRCQQKSQPRRMPLGFDSTTDVGAGSTVPIVAQPQYVFKGERLIVGSAIAPFFIIQDIKIGTKSQLVSAGPVAASAFSEQSFSDNVNMDIARISQFITITVTNTDAADHRFTATLLGTVYE